MGNERRARVATTRLVESGIPIEQAERMVQASQAASQPKDTFEVLLSAVLTQNADKVYEEHRLAWTYDEDVVINGEPVDRVFICKCQEGFDRRGFNGHIRDAYAGLLSSP